MSRKRWAGASSCASPAVQDWLHDLVHFTLSHNLAFKQNLTPFDVGVHPLNRDGVGLPGRERERETEHVHTYIYIIYMICHS